MAFVLCPKHGGHGAAALCSHLATSVIAQSAITDELTPVYVEYEGTTLGPTWLCSLCANSVQIPPAGATLTGEAGLDRYLVEIGFTPVCTHCFDECRGRSS